MPDVLMGDVGDEETALADSPSLEVDDEGVIAIDFQADEYGIIGRNVSLPYCLWDGYDDGDKRLCRCQKSWRVLPNTTLNTRTSFKAVMMA